MIKNLINISYGITVNNETKEIKTLLDLLILLIDAQDEIIVLQDITNENLEVTHILDSYGDKIKRMQSSLNGDFAAFKNNLISASAKKYLFQIDADEYPKPELIKNIKWFLLKNFRADCFLVPRINTVEGITEEDIKNYEWKINEKNYINFPDFQNRLFKVNGKIRWENKVHEKLVNYSKLKRLPVKNENHCLVHPKGIERQRKQNAFYDTLESR